MTVRIGNMDVKVKQAIHKVFAEFFDQISEAADGAIVVEDLQVNTYAVDVSVTMKPREQEEEEAKQPVHQSKALSLWCVVCDALMQREDYDDRHDRYRCPGCEIEVEAEKE